MIEIRDSTGRVLYRHDEGEQSMAAALEAAVEDGVDLSGALLDGEDLSDVDVEGGKNRSKVE
jgi:uncharacterized protein YjbI with pentapeptide repeats